MNKKSIALISAIAIYVIPIVAAADDAQEGVPIQLQESAIEVQETAPIELSVEQLDQITAGVGAGDFPGAGMPGWFGSPTPGCATGCNGLFGSGQFSGPGLNDNANGFVWVPVKTL